MLSREKIKKKHEVKDIQLDKKLHSKIEMHASTQSNIFEVKATCELCGKQFNDVVKYRKDLFVCKKSIECELYGKNI